MILNTFRPLVRLAMPPLTPEGPFKIAVSGLAGSTVRLQRSANLRDWDDWRTLTLGEQPSELADTEAGMVSQRFYRAVGD